jgi:ABC-2 type transport system ATP-binding protein
MSMGNAKKIGLIAAMFTTPRLLVLDEPFANLDPRSQIRLKSYIRTLNEKLGTTVIVSSHDLMHVTDVCRRIAILENGEIVRDLNTSEGTLIDLQRYFSAEAV